MTLSSQEFRKKPLPSSQAAQKSCLKNYIIINNYKQGDDDNRNDKDNDSLTATSTNTATTDEETESSFSTSSSYICLSEMTKHNNKNTIVSFGQIEVREFPIILGDNPSPSDGGIPITIGWKPQRRGFFKSIDHYEQRYHNGPYKKQDRRYGNQLRLDAISRAKLAICGGATLFQIGQTAVTITKIQKQRAQSSQKGPLQLLREGLLFDRNTFPQHHCSRNRKSRNQQQQQQQLSGVVVKAAAAATSFTRVPNEAPRILSAWKANGDRMTM